MEKERARIAVQVQPSASQNKVVRYAEGVLHLKIAAPPVRGKANRELIAFLSDILGVSKSSISIEKGLTSRRKVVVVEGMKQADVEAVIGKQDQLL
jgi:uncharacterized protein (TIGR00251 family)